MKIEALLVLLTSALGCGMQRGPHHPHGQTPVDQKHHHYKPRGSDSLTVEEKVLHDTKHLEEDIKVLTPEMLSAMTNEELEFHYFSAHDYDRNSMLDGLELLKAVYHTDDHEHDADHDNSIEPHAYNIDEYIEMVDQTLNTDDIDGDGYVSYAEYRAARAKNPVERTPRVVASDN